MPELRGPRRLYGGEKSEPGARVKAAAAEGGARQRQPWRASGSDRIKASKSTLTFKTVAHPSPPHPRNRQRQLPLQKQFRKTRQAH